MFPNRNDPCWCSSGRKYKKCHLTEDKNIRSFLNNDCANRQPHYSKKEYAEKNYAYKPSQHLILSDCKSDVKEIIDEIAKNLDPQGRSTMCLYFAILLRYCMKKTGYDLDVVLGDATYHGNNGVFFKWRHAWLENKNIVMDCNADSIILNSHAPEGINPKNYIGSRKDLHDRELNAVYVLADIHENDNNLVDIRFIESVKKSLDDWFFRRNK